MTQVTKEDLAPIQAVRYWLEHTVIGFNFCPFAKREFVRESIDYQISSNKELEEALYQLLATCKKLDENPKIETSLLIFDGGFKDFHRYLDLVDLANQLLEAENYDGVYQLASFHPDYYFDGTEIDDASNYTNRAPYPILHLLREASLEKVLENIENPEEIPTRNIELAQEKGTEVFQSILKKALDYSEKYERIIK